MRMWGSLAVVVAMGIPVLMQMGLPSSDRAFWYGWAATFTGLAMCWGGVEAARWMVRESPWAKAAVPSSDWGKLWVSSGVPGGFIMLFWLLFGWLTHGWLNATLNTVVLGLALLGPIVWLVATPAILKDLKLTPGSTDGIAVKCASALAVHAVGGLVALYIYPHLAGASLSMLFALISSLSVLYPLVFFHLLLVGVILRMLTARKKTLT